MALSSVVFVRYSYHLAGIHLALLTFLILRSSSDKKSTTVSYPVKESHSVAKKKSDVLSIQAENCLCYFQCRVQDGANFFAAEKKIQLTFQFVDLCDLNFQVLLNFPRSRSFLWILDPASFHSCHDGFYSRVFATLNAFI